MQLSGLSDQGSKVVLALAGTRLWGLGFKGLWVLTHTLDPTALESQSPMWALGVVRFMLVGLIQTLSATNERYSKHALGFRGIWYVVSWAWGYGPSMGMGI